MPLPLPSAAPADVVLASGNAGKAREIQALLGPEWRVRPQSEFGVVPVEESGDTFLANALLKARHAARLTGLPALADDSGLEVDALGGEPGVRSARFAGPGADDAANIGKLLAALHGLPDAQRAALLGRLGLGQCRRDGHGEYCGREDDRKHSIECIH